MTTATEISARVVLNIDRCIECHSCAAACYAHHHGMPIIAFGSSPKATLPVICRQCEEAACVDACPNQAMAKDASGVVSRALFRCTGCMSCVVACPFGAIPERLVGGQVPKCDLCEDRVVAGLEPWCVASCSAGALQFMEPDEAEAQGLILLGGRVAGQRTWGRR